MRWTILASAFIALGATAAWSQYRDNTPAFGTVRPSGLVHMLDIEIEGTLAYAGGAGGVWIIDIAGKSNPALLGTYRPRSGGTRGGAQIYGLAVKGDYIYCCERTGGIEIVNIANPSAPVPAGQGYRRDANHSYEHAVGIGDYLYLAAHENGVEVVDIGNPQQPRHVGEIGTANAFALAHEGNTLFVADGAGGLSVLDISAPASPRLLGSAKTTGLAIDDHVDGNTAYLAVGSNGMDVFDIGDPTAPTLVANYHVDGFTNHLNIAGDRAYLANWETVEIVDISTPSRPQLVATQTAFSRAMAVAARDSTFYVGDWAAFRIYGYENAPAPDINTDPLEISFGAVPVDSALEFTMRIENLGQVPLSVTGISASGSGFSVATSAFSLSPFEGRDVPVTYRPASTRRTSGFISIRSDDPDEREKIVPLVGGERTIGVGDIPPDFTLGDIHGKSYHLQNLVDQGYIVVMALFASW